MDQKELYAAQELSALVAANCDMQEVARKAVAREAREGSQTPAGCLSDAVEFGLTRMQEAVSAINQGMLEMYELGRTGGLVWKINEKIREQLNSIRGLQGDSSDSNTDDPVPVSPLRESKESAYPRFIFDLPITGDPTRKADFKDSLQEYSDELKDFLKDKSLPHEIDILLEQLISMDFDPENEASRSEFKSLLDELYQELEKLFPNDVAGQK